MWRQELWHPMTVHVPVALLLFGSVLYLAYLLLRNRKPADKLRFSARAALVSGVIGSWLAVFTGHIADGVVGRDLCDPLVLKAHESYAYGASYLFTVVLAADVLLSFVGRERLQSWGRVMLGLACLAGAGLIGYTGHLGAKLVYQQAAAVYQPSDDCEEFRR